MERIVSLIVLGLVLAIAPAVAETRCVKDYTGAVVCTDYSSGTSTRCVKDYTGAIVCN